MEEKINGMKKGVKTGDKERELEESREDWKKGKRTVDERIKKEREGETRR